MFAKAIKKVNNAIFPVFSSTIISPNQINISVAGTGFFINADGYFISVAHVFASRTHATKHLFYGFLPDKLQTPALEIKEIFRDDKNDVFIGKIETNTPDFLYLLDGLPPVGRSVCISGYPMATITNNDQGGIELSGVRRYYQPSFVLDYANCNIDSGQGPIRNHDGFVVRDVGLFGMSGGPVFDKNARVLGIQASVTNPRISSNGTRQLIVENAIAIKSMLILNILKKNKIKLYGSNDNKKN